MYISLLNIYVSKHTYIIDVRMHMYIFNNAMYTCKKTIRIFKTKNIAVHGSQSLQQQAPKTCCIKKVWT
jgi:hypothetical protein